jgi:hypothetical protein
MSLRDDTGCPVAETRLEEPIEPFEPIPRLNGRNAGGRGGTAQRLASFGPNALLSLRNRSCSGRGRLAASGGPATNAGERIHPGTGERAVKDLTLRLVGMPRPPAPGDTSANPLPSPSSLQPSRDDTLDDKEAAKLARKLERTSDGRTLDSWERYRALVDLLEHYVNLSEIADRRTRFALIIMGSLNAFSVLVILRPALFGTSLSPHGWWLGAYLVAYAMLSGYLFVHAINTLRPRVGSGRGLLETHAPADWTGAGLRFPADATRCSPEEYYARWTGARLGVLSAEGASQVQGFARINAEKLAALDRVYKGLVALTILSAALLVALAVLGVRG